MKVPLQFLIRVINITNNCSSNPYILDISDSFCLYLNDTFNIRIYAYTQCQNDNITEIQILGPSGLQIEQLEMDANNNSLWYRDVYWPATIPGKHSICIKAIDSFYLSTASVCSTIIVHQSNLTIDQSSIHPIGLLNITDNNVKSINFCFSFNQNILRPNKSAFLHIMSAFNDQVLVKLPSNNGNVSFLSINSSSGYINSISFTIDIDLLPEGSYYVKLDEGDFLNFNIFIKNYLIIQKCYQDLQLILIYVNIYLNQL